MCDNIAFDGGPSSLNKFSNFSLYKLRAALEVLRAIVAFVVYGSEENNILTNMEVVP